MLVIKAGIHIVLTRKANREDPHQAVSSEAVRSGSALFVTALGRQLVSKFQNIYRNLAVI